MPSLMWIFLYLNLLLEVAWLSEGELSTFLVMLMSRLKNLSSAITKLEFKVERSLLIHSNR